MMTTKMTATCRFAITCMNNLTLSLIIRSRDDGVYKKKMCSTQLSIELQMLITAKMLTIKEFYCFQTLICCVYHANKY